jgi:lipoate-protein ligase A
MRLLDLTLGTAAENLALDEALLDAAEAGDLGDEVLRFWESPEPFVVLGRSSKVAEEVNHQECGKRGMPILRRCSGGASVLAGPGCLMYALVLSQEQRPELALVSEAHRLVMETMVRGLASLIPGVAFLGTSDLAIGHDKFSGNSLRLKRSHLLYHGTLLYAFPLATIAACLRAPPRQPEYRQGRSHGDFLVNVAASPNALRKSLKQAWRVTAPLANWPQARTLQLAADKYQKRSWNYRL